MKNAIREKSKIANFSYINIIYFMWMLFHSYDVHECINDEWIKCTFDHRKGYLNYRSHFFFLYASTAIKMLNNISEQVRTGDSEPVDLGYYELYIVMV